MKQLQLSNITSALCLLRIKKQKQKEAHNRSGYRITKGYTADIQKITKIKKYTSRETRLDNPHSVD